MVFKKRRLHTDIALACLRAIAGQKVGRNHVFDNIHYPGSKEGHTVVFLNAALKCITNLTTTTNKDSRHTILVTFIGRSLSLGASVSATGRPFCRVTHCFSIGASTQATSLAF